MKKTNKAKLIKQLDKECMSLWGKLVYARAKGKCELCGKKGRLQAHHIFSRRRHLNTKFSLDNGIALCYYCHFIKVHNEGCQELGAWLVANRGQEWYDNLRKASKVTVYDKSTLLEEQKRILGGIK